MTVNFSNVGRQKLSWAAEVPSLSDAVLIREIKRKGALLSAGIYIEWRSETAAVLIVGGFRTVGELSVEGGAKLL